MRAAPILLLVTAAATAATAGPGAIDVAQFARGAAAVGERPSDAIALRQMENPSHAFRLGAAYRAWRNARAAIDHDASHSTGDGGDEQVLAEDCSDERIAFGTLEAERDTLGLTVEQIGAAVSLVGIDGIASWRARQSHAAEHCRR